MKLASQSIQDRPKLDALTSLRLVAAFVVVVFHARGSLLPASLTVPGGEAVSFFFVLSGFILTYAYHKRRYTLKSFYLARLARILPASVLSIAVYILLINPYTQAQSPNPAITASNLLLIQSLIPIPAYYFALNAVLWSVSVEIFFYLVFPALDRCLHSFSGRILLIFISVLAGILMVSLSLLHQFPDFSASAFNQVTWHGLVYINPLSRLKEFMFGMLAGGWFLAMRVQSWIFPRKAILFTVLEAVAIGALLLPFLKGHFPMEGTILKGSSPMFSTYLSQSQNGIFFALIILVFAVEGGLLSRALKNRMLVIGGEISFSIYLFHQILIVWQYNNPWVLGWCPMPFRFAVLSLVIILASYGIWRLFECPMRGLIRRAFDRR